MEQLQSKMDIISQLRKDLLLWEGFKAPLTNNKDMLGLGPIEAAFPNGIFPKGKIHEFLSGEPEHAAAAGGFIAGILKILMLQGGVCLWIGTARTLFPPALKVFGVEPDRIIFIDLKREKDILWATEEALKCEGIAAVITEVKVISFAESRRLQLAVEKSRVTSFIIRTDAEKVTATASVARWKITPIPSELEDGLPGVGFPRWNVELLKVRNGNPGAWQMEWSADHFTLITKKVSQPVLHKYRRKAG
jgi:protein ImuA